ncbi:class I SAM-dependent methyltransferase [Thalassovita mediterranea]|nr:class I SAM-dependent methyltransferase [Thalassovita mediterranea]
MSNAIARILETVKDRGGPAAVIKNAASRPSAMAKALIRAVAGNWRAMAAGTSKKAEHYHSELRDSGLVETLNSRLTKEFTRISGAQVRGKAAVPGGMRSLHAEVLWLLVRSRKPATVVETGVCNGLSSAVLLEALSRNGLGTLISVDLPEFTDPALNRFEVWDGKGGAAVPAGKDVGWLVRDDLKSYWQLELGPSQRLLPPLLARISPVDLFIHDSEHSYENQMFEFRLGFEALRPGGVLVATDITWSDAFDHFWKEIRATGARRVFVDPSCALVEKL